MKFGMGRVEKRDWRMAVTMNGGAKVVNALREKREQLLRRNPTAAANVGVQ